MGKVANTDLNVGKDRSKRKKSCTYDSIMTIKNHLILSLKIERELSTFISGWDEKDIKRCILYGFL